jgi:hypothetical protein
MKKFVFIVTFLLMIISTNSCARGKVKIVCGISETAQIGINHLQPLVDALEKYKADHGKYPTADTKDFVPKYIDRIPIILNAGVSKEIGNAPIFNALRHEKLESMSTLPDETGQTFNIGFYTKDDRFCLTGKNNICEFKSGYTQWRCYQ